MSSTSSHDRSPPSATETLASRYRHLFVLPSSYSLLLYGGLGSLGLALLSKGTAGLPAFILSFAVFILATAAVSSALRISDRITIASFRRVSAVLLAGDVIWVILAAVGAGWAWAVGSPRFLTNALLYGAFVCAGLEFLIIYGAFAESAALSLILAALHPGATVLILRFNELAAAFDPLSAAFCVASLSVIIAYPLLLARKRTSLGWDSVSLFRAFMKTWAAGQAKDLEGIIAEHSETTEITTKVLRFSTKTGDIYLALPGVHPGPFHPIGSYDLPGVISREFKELGPVMTLHRPGGHEHNLATRDDTMKYAVEVKGLAQSISPGEGAAQLHGPFHAQIGMAKVSATSFSNDLLMTISFAPQGSDDLDSGVERELSKAAEDAGFRLSVIDAHNSIANDLESPATDDPGWSQLCKMTKDSPPEAFSVAYAHSGELGFKGSRDLTENGLAVFMIRSGATKSVLVLADANNSVPSLKGLVSEALTAAGYTLIEFCTSDSHNLAARGLTVERGYEALGEATPPPSISDLAVRLARLAETRLAPAKYGSGQSRQTARIFGTKALEEFAAIAQKSSDFSRSYFRFAVVTTATLLVLSLAF